MKLISLILITIFLNLGLAAPLVGNVTDPTEDPFYTPRPGYENLKLGEVIAYRKVTHPYGLVIFKDKVEAAYQFLVRSEDSHGNASAVTTTLFIPYNADPSKLLSYQIAIDTTDPNCQPSYAMQLGSNPASWATPQIELLLINTGLYEGWYVNVPDFLGPRQAFVAGYQAAYATLNSIKAVLSSGDFTGIKPDAEVVAWGYSGGSQPTSWGAAIQPTYAPEVKFVGAAVGGILIDPHTTWDLIAGTVFSGFIISGIEGISREYPELGKYLQDNVYPKALGKINASGDECALEALLKNTFINWNDISPLGANFLDKEPMANILEENNLLNLNDTPKAPLYFYNSVNDEVVPASDADKLYTKWCGEGVDITYNQDHFSEHITQSIFGAGLAFRWLRDRLNNVPVDRCTKTDRFSNLEIPGAIPGLVEIVRDFLLMITGHNTGPGTSGTEFGPKANGTEAAQDSLMEIALEKLVGNFL